ncbi:MAG: hypothetical protein U0R64_07525 [Candidatus Nanopelagicales bacterium]
MTPTTDDDDFETDQAERELEQAEEAVEHQASYGSPSLDEMDVESDGDLWESEVTGSAPQEGQ